MNVKKIVLISAFLSLMAGSLVQGHAGCGSGSKSGSNLAGSNTEDWVAGIVSSFTGSQGAGAIAATLIIAPVIAVYTIWASGKIKKWVGYKSDLDLTGDRLFAALKARTQQIEELQRKLADLEAQTKETRSKSLQQELNLVKAELTLAQNHRNELLAEVAQEKDADGEACESCCH